MAFCKDVREVGRKAGVGGPWEPSPLHLKLFFFHLFSVLGIIRFHLKKGSATKIERFQGCEGFFWLPWSVVSFSCRHTQVTPLSPSALNTLQLPQPVSSQTFAHNPCYPPPLHEVTWQTSAHPLSHNSGTISSWKPSSPVPDLPKGLLGAATNYKVTPITALIVPL